MKTENKFYFSEDFYSKFPFTGFNEWHFGAKNEELQFNQVFTMLVNETQIHSIRSWLIFLNVATFSSENNPNVDSSYIKVGTFHEKYLLQYCNTLEGTSKVLQYSHFWLRRKFLHSISEILIFIPWTAIKTKNKM